VKRIELLIGQSKPSAMEAPHPVMCECEDQKPSQKYSVIDNVHHRRKPRVSSMLIFFGRPSASNEKEISRGRVSWQTLWTYFAMGPLASSIGRSQRFPATRLS
jgi:hypothetical protein